jgi:hypothetical protein
VYKVSTRTPTPTITNSPLAKTSSSNLSTGALVGTIAGSLVGGILLGLAALGGFLLFRKSKNKSTWSNAHELNEHHKLVELEDHKAATELEDKQTSEMPGGQQDAREMYALPVELPGHMNATLHIPQEYHAR